MKALLNELVDSVLTDLAMVKRVCLMLLSEWCCEDGPPVRGVHRTRYLDVRGSVFS